MIETLVVGYLLVGCIISLVIWLAAFQPDFDDFCREDLKEEPLTTSQKWTVIILTPFIWPITLYRMITDG